jgi:coproporphyrinogen III oxidase
MTSHTQPPESDRDFDRVRAYLTDLQDRICAAIEHVDGSDYGATFWLLAGDQPV